MDIKTLNLTLLLNQTMSEAFEHIKADKETILKIMNKEPVEINKTDYRIIYQFSSELLRIMSLKKELEFDDILKINKNIGYKLNLDNGEFADKPRFVSSFDNRYITIPVIDKNQKREEFSILVKYLKTNESQKVEIILNFFIDQITEQWFKDGNKRTALIVCNKLLLQFCCSKENNLLISFDNKKFNEYLAFFYLEKYNQKNQDNIARLNLINFLSESIKNNEKINNLNNTVFEQLNSLFGYKNDLSNKEIIELTSPNSDKNNRQKLKKDIGRER